jgi:hypothetical protein
VLVAMLAESPMKAQLGPAKRMATFVASDPLVLASGAIYRLWALK